MLSPSLLLVLKLAENIRFGPGTKLRDIIELTLLTQQKNGKRTEILLGKWDKQVKF